MSIPEGADAAPFLKRKVIVSSGTRFMGIHHSCSLNSAPSAPNIVSVDLAQRQPLARRERNDVRRPE